MRRGKLDEVERTACRFHPIAGSGFVRSPAHRRLALSDAVDSRSMPGSSSYWELLFPYMN